MDGQKLKVQTFKHEWSGKDRGCPQDSVCGPEGGKNCGLLAKTQPATHPCKSRVTGTQSHLFLHGSSEQLLPLNRDLSSCNRDHCANKAWNISLVTLSIESVCQSLMGNVDGKMGRSAKGVSSHEVLFCLFLKYGLNFVKGSDSTSSFIFSSSQNSNKIRMKMGKIYPQ